MAAGRKSDFTLPTLDDLFSSQSERDEAKLAKIRDIPLTEIDDFPNHPFKVRDDEDMVQLIDSIKERGVITPAMVRQKDDGRYEIISGHRRCHAALHAHGCSLYRRLRIADGQHPIRAWMLEDRQPLYKLFFLLPHRGDPRGKHQQDLPTQRQLHRTAPIQHTPRPVAGTL